MGYRKFVCEACSHVYDEALGDPAAGLAAGTRWEDIPEDWVCPECGATKADFILAEAQLAVS
jgi:rubredoxin